MSDWGLSYPLPPYGVLVPVSVGESVTTNGNLRVSESRAGKFRKGLLGIKHHGGTFLGGSAKFHCLAEVGSGKGLLAEVLVEQGT